LKLEFAAPNVLVLRQDDPALRAGYREPFLVFGAFRKSFATKDNRLIFGAKRGC